MAIFCDQCGTPMNDNDTYCPNCGAPAVAAQAPAYPDYQAPQYGAQPQQYYPPQQQGYQQPAYPQYQQNAPQQPTAAYPAKSVDNLTILLIVLGALLVIELVVSSLWFPGFFMPG